MFPRVRKAVSRASFPFYVVVLIDWQLLNISFLSKVYRSFLMSVTVTDDVDKTRYLKGPELRSPIRMCSVLLFEF